MKRIKNVAWWQVVALFTALAIIALLPQLHKQLMYINSWDVPFHLSRMYEIKKGFEVGKWVPDVSAYTFGQNGYGVNLFYGYSFTYMVALVYFLTNQAVAAVIISYVILLAGAMCINFYATKQFFIGENAKLKALSFSILYVIAPVTFGQMQVRGIPGELVGILLFPAVLIAFYGMMFRNQKNYIFAGVMTAIVVTNHVLSAFLLVIILTILFIVYIYQRRVNLMNAIELLKSIILSFALSAFYVLPFLEHLLYDHIAGANNIWGTVDVWGSIASSLGNQATLNWTAISVGVFVFVMTLSIAIILFCLRMFTGYIAKIGFVLLISIMMVFYFPTNIFAKTPLHVFQMMARFYPLIMTLSLIFVIEGMDNLYQIKWLKLKTVTVLVGLGVTLAISSAWQMQFASYYHNTVPMANYQKNKQIFPKLVSNKDFTYQLTHYYQLPLGSKDYLGKGRVKFDNGYQVTSWGDVKDASQIYVDGRLSKLKLTHDQYRFNVKNIPSYASHILLPMTNYKGWYVTSDSGKRLPVTVENGKMLVSVKNVQSINLVYHKTTLHLLGIIVSVTTILFLIVLICFKSIFSKKINLKSTDNGCEI